MSKTLTGSGNSNLFQDVHLYSDGTLRKYRINNNKYPREYKEFVILRLINIINQRANREIVNFGINGLKLIYNDIGTPNNYQHIDDINAETVLVEIYNMIKNETDIEIIDTAINHICEQMKDMLLTGTCPNGRSNRLMFIYFYLFDYYKNKNR